MAQPNNVTPDTLLAARVAKAIEIRDRANTSAIRFQTEVDLAKKAAEESKKEASTEHHVDTLNELLEKTQLFYKEDLASVELFENAVTAWAAEIEKAAAILAEANTL